MSEQNVSCDHRWRYFVNLQSRAVRVRQCERCGTRVVMAAAPLEPEKQPA